MELTDDIVEAQYRDIPTSYKYIRIKYSFDSDTYELILNTDHCVVCLWELTFDHYGISVSIFPI